jgi:hypothetical protein
VAETGGDAVNDRRLEALVVEERRQHEAAERRFVADRALGLLADAGPDRIDDAGDRLGIVSSRARLAHDDLLPQRPCGL